MKGVFPFVRAAFLLEKALSYVEKALFIVGLLTENVPAERRSRWQKMSVPAEKRSSRQTGEVFGQGKRNKKQKKARKKVAALRY